MSRFDLSAPPPPDVAALPFVYVLGVGGPEDTAGIGRIEAFVWRCAVLEGGPGPGAAPIALAFTSMPRLMAFTRAVNDAAPRRVPTEAARVAPSSWRGGIPAVLWLDPTPEAFEAELAGRALVERRIPELAP